MTGSIPAAAPAAERTREVVALVCSQCVSGDFHPSRVAAAVEPARVQVVMIPCTSKLEAGHLLGILDRGADGVLVLGCLGSRCQFQVGSARAAKRIAYAQDLLDQIGLGGWRLKLSLDGSRTAQDVARLASDLSRLVAANPPNPVGRPGRPKI